MPEEHMREGHGLSSAAARLPQPCWEVHHSSEHPTVRLCCSILTHCKLCEASSGPENSISRIMLSWEFSTPCLLSTHGDATHGSISSFINSIPIPGRVNPCLSFMKPKEFWFLVNPPRLGALRGQALCFFSVCAPGRHSTSYKAQTQSEYSNRQKEERRKTVDWAAIYYRECIA